MKEELKISQKMKHPILEGMIQEEAYNGVKKTKRDWNCSMHIEESDSVDDVQLFSLGKEILVFYQNEKKCRFSFPVSEYKAFLDT